MRGRDRWVGLAAGGGMVVLWSSGFIGARLAADAAHVLTVLLWRSLLATVLLLAWCAVLRRRRVALREIGVQAGIGLLAQSTYLLSVFAAVAFGVSSGTTSLIDAIQPLLVSALAVVLLRETVLARQWLGLVCGLGGVALVVCGDLTADAATPLWAYAVPFLGMVALSVATLLQRRSRAGTALPEALLVQCATSTVVFGVLASASGTASPVPRWDFWSAVLFAAILPTFGGYGLYWWNLRRLGAAGVSKLMYLIPPTTVLWAYWWFGDRITMWTLLGMAVTLAAVYLARNGGRRVRREPDRAGARRDGAGTGRSS